MSPHCHCLTQLSFIDKEDETVIKILVYYDQQRQRERIIRESTTAAAAAGSLDKRTGEVKDRGRRRRRGRRTTKTREFVPFQ